ncbi:MAG: urease accessory protein UreD, partial [Gammaproteobacteria bacterium]|nr:urease accessory protein UreD [Gammaproteobacteria bacterium]
VVQKPFYPENGLCHVYIIHPPGGIVGGDTLSINVTNHDASQALITTPAANKFYRSAGPIAHLDQRLSIEKNACLEWLPQETILFNGCAVHSTTRIQLNDNSRFMGWEITCLGRPASGEAFSNGLFRQQLELYQYDVPLFIERALLHGGHPILEAPWGLQSFTVTATLIAYPADKPILELARTAIVAQTDYLCSATLINKVLVCRYLGHHGEQAKNVFTAIWSAIRPACMNREACIPRIWNT